MSYEKNTWAKGDVITANKLNHMEDGIADGGVLIVNAIHDEQTETTTLDKTWQQIYDATYPMLIQTDPTNLDANKAFRYPEEVFVEDSVYKVAVGLIIYTTDSPDGYPVWEDGEQPDIH